MLRRFPLYLAAASVLTIGAGFQARAGITYTDVPAPGLPSSAGDLNTGTAADYWYANAFTALPTGQYLTRLDVGFGGGLPVGTPVSVLVYEDPSQTDDPTDLQLIQQTTGTVASSDGTDLYTPQAFTIPTTYVSGDFFVAVEVDNVPASARGIALDTNSPQGRSFMAINLPPDTGTMTPTNINDADYPPVHVEALFPYSSPTFNFFIGAKGRATQYAEAQDPLVFDGFNTGNFSISSNGIQVNASDAIGGNRIATIATSNGPGSVSVANGVLTLNNCQASIAYGSEYAGGSGFESGLNTYAHANLDGYDFMQFHFLQSGGSVLMGAFGAATPTSYAIDANGNLDLNIAGQDWTDFNSFSFTIYSYGKSISLDSITLLANPIPGDVNGDGLLNADDYALIDRGYAAGLTGHVNGDLNGDGVVNAADFLIIDTAFAKANGDILSPDFLAERDAQFGAGYVAELEAAVPEPTCIAACGLALPLLLRRRR
jgi:Dockerin type I domain